MGEKGRGRGDTTVTPEKSRGAGRGPCWTEGRAVQVLGDEGLVCKVALRIRAKATETLERRGQSD
jgi:hypothetical protein